jgi:NADPH-dependent glutamate synthase beta subunit-like oxidoreductase/Pyruvate/2-oxoacid:ferredoxin oxidoreductase delta subunit
MTETLTYRRFKDGEQRWPRLTDNIFMASHSHKCPTYQQSTAPCQAGCPAGEDIRGYLGIARGTEKPPAGMPWQEYAWRRLTQANPFPAVMGRVCPAPCEAKCNRNALEAPVGINALEHFLGDWAIGKGLAFMRAGAPSGKKVAVVGGGPAGLSCAYQLARKGHAVSVFEAQPELGGMMRYGIPGFRVPRPVLDAEIQRILDLGVEARLGVRVGREVSLERLGSEFDAVFLGLGAQGARPLPVPGADAPECVSATAFLGAFNEGRLRSVPKRVVVVGGGDTSIDVATVARRLGHRNGNGLEAAEVTLTSVFRRDKMQASPHEVEHAIAEGITLREGWAPLEVVRGANERATGLRIAKCEARFVGPKLEIKLDEASAEVIAADLVVSAIGQAVDFSGLEAFDAGKGVVVAERTGQVSGQDSVFAGGDVLKPHLLATAIGQGWIAAEGIDRKLRGEPLEKRPKVDVHAFRVKNAGSTLHNYDDRTARYVIASKELFLGHFPYAPRNERALRRLSAEQALGNFEERLGRLEEKEAAAEARRCMSCGLCLQCDNCVVYCPQGAVSRVKKDKASPGRYVETDYVKCIGCHICRDVCPAGYIQMGLGE